MFSEDFLQLQPTTPEGQRRRSQALSAIGLLEYLGVPVDRWPDDAQRLKQHAAAPPSDEKRGKIPPYSG